MKKFFTFLALLFVSGVVEAQILLSKPEASNEISEAIIDRKFDDNKQLCALISAEITGLTLDQVQRMELNTDNASNIYLSGEVTDASMLRFYISPKATYIEVAVPGYERVRLQLDTELRGGKFYKMKLHARPLEVEITVLSSVYSGAEVYIDESFVGTTPLTTKVKYGVPFTLRVHGDISEIKENIILTEQSEKAFDFTHLLGSKNISLTVNHLAEVQVDGVVVGRAQAETPFILQSLVYGRHEITVKAIDFVAQPVSRVVTISANSNEALHMEIEHTKQVTIDANVSGASIVVDGKQLGETSLTTYLTYGKHEMTLTNAGKSKTGTINVNDKNAYFYWKLPKPSTRYHRGYSTRDIELRPYGLMVGYVQKQWLWKNDVQKLKTGYWGSEEKALNGLQAGLRIEPHLGWWFYMHTGLYYEYYFDKSEEYTDSSGYPFFCKFQEHVFNIPLQLEFKMPVSDDFYFYLTGGVSFDIGLSASVDFYDIGASEPYGSHTEIYGSTGLLENMKRCNVTGDFGGGFSVGRCKFGCTVSRGLINMSFDESYTLKINKIAGHFSLMF